MVSLCPEGKQQGAKTELMEQLGSIFDLAVRKDEPKEMMTGDEEGRALGVAVA